MSRLLILMLCSLLLAACGGGGSSGSTATSVYSISLTFSRDTGSTPNPFQVTASLYKDGEVETGAAANLDITLDRGSQGVVSEIAPGQYQFTVTPTGTGEYPVTVSYHGVSVQRTALVLAGVQTGWGQPMAVAGLVNTPGYEDGVTVSGDGQYLFVQYGPLYFSAIQLFNTPRANGGCGGDRLNPTRCSHPWLDNTIGPYAAPERPGFFTGRIDVSNGTNLHNANSWMVGDDQSPIFAPSTMFYGFKRQADGSYAEPFYLTFADDNDALANPYGMSFVLHGDGTATMAFAFDDPADSDMVDVNGDGSLMVASGADVYTDNITLGHNTNLGTLIPSGVPGTHPIHGSPFASQLVNFGKTGTNGIYGTQGNPHLYAGNGSIKSIWTDDEQDSDSDRGDLSVYVLTAGTFPNGSWSKLVLPTVINQALPSNEIQPFFTGSGLYFTRSSDTELPAIYYSAYSGAQTLGDYQNANNWTTPTKLLSAAKFTPANPADIGKIVAVGEPTLAHYAGHDYLYFVYGYIRGFDSVSGLPDIDMQAGYIRKQ
jgi:hypothetical protein